MKRNRFLIVPLLLLAGGAALAQTPQRSRVVVARSAAVVDERNRCDAAVAARLLERSLLALTGAATPAAAWAALGLTAADTVAIKVNCNDWTVALHPHPELLDALCRSLQTVIPAERIIVYEAAANDLRRAGFTLNRSAAGVRCIGADEGGGYDEAQGLTRIVTRTASKVINLASLKTVDGDLGVSLFFKNHVGSLRPADMAKCHDDPDFLAGILARPAIRDKTILNLLDGLRGTYRRGVPWYWRGIILSRDPLAAETTAIAVINEKRQAENLPPLPPFEWLRLAEAKYGLGSRHGGAIDLVRIDN